MVKPGTSLTELTVMTNVWFALLSMPPLTIPPSSWMLSVIAAEPFASAAGVKVSVPMALTAGAALNRAGFVLPTMLKCTVWLDSFGPGLMKLAQPSRVCGPASSLTVWSAPLTKLGASLIGLTVIVTVATFESA